MTTRRRKNHRQKVGGLWDQMGELQLEFLRVEGLQPDHRFLDVGCGSLRAGVKLIRYLDDGNYHGLDRDRRLVAAGVDIEMPRAGVDDAEIHLTVTPDFEIPEDWPRFDYGIAQSVFTHLPADKVAQAFAQLSGRVERFYATHWPTSSGRRFAYDAGQVAELAAGWEMTPIGDWGHPRGQLIARFE